MTIKVTLMTPADIDGAIVTIQEAFKDDPYSNWVFDKSQVRARAFPFAFVPFATM